MTVKRGRTGNIVAIGDLHAGCRFGLFPETGVQLAGGMIARASRMQEKLGAWWHEFWHEFVPHATRGEKFSILLNGDLIDGVHHRATTQVTHNMSDQEKIALALLEPLKGLEGFNGRIWVNYGTEAHVGPSGEFEERIAKALGAQRTEADGEQFGHWETVLEMGGRRIHATHHIGVAHSPFTKTSALLREMVNHYVEAGQWRDDPYSMFVRSHRHEYAEIADYAEHGKVVAFSLPAWQLKTPYVYRIPARMKQPQIGGGVIRLADEELFVRMFLKRLSPPRGEAA